MFFQADGARQNRSRIRQFKDQSGVETHGGAMRVGSPQRSP